MCVLEEVSGETSNTECGADKFKPFHQAHSSIKTAYRRLYDGVMPLKSPVLCVCPGAYFYLGCPQENVSVL